MEEKYQKIIEAAQAGGNVLKQYFGKDLDIVEKLTPADFVTKADLESERVILDILKENFPDFNIYSEEEGKIDKGSEYTFVIDPLDGSNNFVIGVPFFSSNIALMKGDEIIFSVVYEVMGDRTFHAIKNKGAFLNGDSIKVNDVSDIIRVTVSYFCHYKIDKKTYYTLFGKLYNTGLKRVLANWSPAIEFGLLASGKIEAMISKDNETYDFLAGKLIAKEAGAVIIDFDGQEEKSDNNNSFIIANNKIIANKILEAVK